MSARKGLVRFDLGPRHDSLSPSIVPRLKRLLSLLDDLEDERIWLQDAVRGTGRAGVAGGATRREPVFRRAPLMTVADVAELVGVSQRTIFRAIASGDLETLRAGAGQRANHRITDDAVRRWLERRTAHRGD